MKKNIGFLGNQIAPGGGSASLLLMIKSLAKSNVNVFVLSSDCANNEVRAEFEFYCKTVTIDKRIKQFVSCAGNPPKLIDYLKAIINRKKQVKIIKDFIEKNNLDILHINNAVFSHLYPYLKKTTNIKIVTHVREQINLFGKKYLESIIINNIERNSDKIICISEKEALPFNNYSKIVIMANPFDFSMLNSIEDSDFRNLNNIGKNEIIICMMGRFARDKGHLLFLQAAKCIIDNPEVDELVRFVILGVNPPKPKWKLIVKRILNREEFRNVVLDYIESNNLLNRVVLYPYIKNVNHILKEVDIYVRPSLTKDPWGRDIIEAMALKRIVVATGDYEFFIKDGITGFLVKEIQPEGLSNTIIKAIHHLKNNSDIQRNAYNHIYKMTNLDSYRLKLNHLYDSI